MRQYVVALPAGQGHLHDAVIADKIEIIDGALWFEDSAGDFLASYARGSWVKVHKK